MANKAYQEGPGNKAKEGKKGGMKNVDGRLKGAEFNTQKKVDFNPKSVGVEPNDGAPKLKSHGKLDKGAY